MAVETPDVEDAARPGELELAAGRLRLHVRRTGRAKFFTGVDAAPAFHGRPRARYGGLGERDHVRRGRGHAGRQRPGPRRRRGLRRRPRELLSPFVPKGAPPPSSGDDTAVELRGARAEATGPADPTEGLELWEAYYHAARDAEKAWARRRATALAGHLSPEAAWRAWGAAAPGGLTRAVLGARAAAHLRDKGDPAGAAFVETETHSARHLLGFAASGSPVGPGDPPRLGLALPLSGKFQVVGEAALRAAMLAAGPPAAGVAGNGGT